MKKVYRLTWMVKPDQPHLFFIWQGNDIAGGIKRRVKKRVNCGKISLTRQKLTLFLSRSMKTKRKLPRV